MINAGAVASGGTIPAIGEKNMHSRNRAPILVIVGYYMMTLVKDIDWADPGIGIPVLLTIALMPFTYSITNGVGAGFLSYTVIAVLRGRARDVHPLMYVVSAIFVWYYVNGTLA